MRLLKAELLKISYQRAMWGLLLAAVLFSALGTGASAFAIDRFSEDLAGGTLSETPYVDAVYANAVSGYIFAMLVGVLIVAGEFHHGTAVATFIAVPKRSRVLLAKMVAAGIAGLVLQGVAAAMGFLGGYLALLAYPDAASPSIDIFINTSLASLVSGVVLGILGAAIGALVRSQVLALVGVLLWLFAIEPIVIVLLPEIANYSLTGLITGIISLDLQTEALNVDFGAYLPPLTATLFLFGYAVVFALVALISSMRRDID
jgi:ABC-2 type transport system permease protein